MSNQPLIQDTGISVLDRAMSMKTYADAFKFWMIGVVDPDGTISSTLRPKIAKLKRDYIPRIMRTGKRELSDPFPAGATGDMNFTQFMPIKKDGKVISICFVTTPLAHMSQLPPFRARYENGYYLLVDSRRSIIAHPDANKLMMDIKNLVEQETFLIGGSRQQFLDDIANRRSGSFICFFEGRLTFTFFTTVADSKWTLIHRVPMLPTMYPMLWSFGVQTLLYALFFVLLLRNGRKSFAPVDNIVRHVIDLNKSIRDSEPLSMENAGDLIKISRRGLFDMLTGLPTRHLFHQQINELLEEAPDRLYGIFFFDMDRLKPINDNLGMRPGTRRYAASRTVLRRLRKSITAWPAATAATNSCSSCRCKAPPISRNLPKSCSKTRGAASRGAARITSTARVSAYARIPAAHSLLTKPCAPRIWPCTKPSHGAGVVSPSTNERRGNAVPAPGFLSRWRCRALRRACPLFLFPSPARGEDFFCIFIE